MVRVVVLVILGMRVQDPQERVRTSGHAGHAREGAPVSAVPRIGARGRFQHLTRFIRAVFSGAVRSLRRIDYV